MLTLILVLAVLAMIACIASSKFFSSHKHSDYFAHWLSFWFAWIFGGISCGIIIAICCIAPQVATASTIDSKIAMYQEENATIEQNIDRVVDAYLEHEHETFADLKTEESSITLVTLFPELKSDTLVQQQLEIYVDNNAKIKELKEAKIDIAKKRWLIYFSN